MSKSLNLLFYFTYFYFYMTYFMKNLSLFVISANVIYHYCQYYYYCITVVIVIFGFCNYDSLNVFEEKAIS